MPKGLQEITDADWIKFYADRAYTKQAVGSYKSLPNFTKEEITAIGDETIRSGKKLAAHAITGDGVIASINAGASSIEHGFGMDDECLKLSEPELFRKAIKAGLPIAYGTDIGGYDWNEPQSKDFEFMVQYGMGNEKQNYL